MKKPDKSKINLILRRVVFAGVAVALLVVSISLWSHWYNSPAYRLNRDVARSALPPLEVLYGHNDRANSEFKIIATFAPCDSNTCLKNTRPIIRGCEAAGSNCAWPWLSPAKMPPPYPTSLSSAADFPSEHQQSIRMLLSDSETKCTGISREPVSGITLCINTKQGILFYRAVAD